MATDRSMLFSWDDVERLPELRRLGFVLDNLPDGAVVAALEAKRGRGRDGYPVEAMWRALVAGVSMPMAFQGFEADRGTLKYRCPAAAYGLDRKGRAACLRDAGSKAGNYGRVVRVELASSDRRMFTPTPWGSPSWKRGYNRRGALERINARLDGSFGFECHFVRGGAKMTTRLGLAVAVMMALALGAVLAGRPERMRSLVDPGLPLAA